jgi:beta-barrel assembly-enhancing protease
VTGRVAPALAVVLALALVGCETGAGGLGGGMGNVLGVMTSGLTGTAPGDVRGASVDIDEAEEIELGRAVTATLGSRYKLLRDEPLTRYVALVGNSVALQSDRPDLRYYFGILDSDEVNAFAAPGGYVFVTKGTLGLMRDEATLAGVLGHEIGHIALRHHVETLKDEKKTALGKGIGTTALQIGAGFIPGIGGTVTSAAVNSPLMNVMADGVGNLVLKGFSRKEEGEADNVGYKYAARAGYDAAGLRDFLKTTQERGTQPAVNKFFATHPGTDERLKEQETALKTVPAGGRRAAPRFQQAMAAKPPTR